MGLEDEAEHYHPMPFDFSLRSPVVLSRQVPEGATRKFAIGRPSWVRQAGSASCAAATQIRNVTMAHFLISED
jgi:hypothetical protein